MRVNFRKLIAELVEIEGNPKPTFVNITHGARNRTIYTFTGPPHYYPSGIVRICVQRGGAGVVYVYTTAQDDPHLTISDNGNYHWTDAQHNYHTPADPGWPPVADLFLQDFLE